jgi:hypothetical protein
LIFIFAPLSRRSEAVAVRPLAQAQIRAVSPIYRGRISNERRGDKDWIHYS